MTENYLDWHRTFGKLLGWMIFLSSITRDGNPTSAKLTHENITPHIQALSVIRKIELVAVVVVDPHLLVEATLTRLPGAAVIAAKNQQHNPRGQ